MRKTTVPRKQYFGWLSSLLLFPSKISCFIPPHPDSDLAETWEPIDSKRRRLQQSYNYNPLFVHPELCRHLSETECQDVDETLHDHSRRLLQASQRQPDFADHIDADSDFSSLLNHLDYPSAKSGTAKSRQDKDSIYQEPPLPRRNPSIVKSDEPIIEVLILLMRFQDHKDRELPKKSEYADLWNERIHHWFDLNSYGNYRYRATVTDWMDTDDTEATYAAGVSGLRYSLQQSIWPLLDQLNQDPEWDWSKFDQDGDGKLDSVVILHSGYPAEVGGRDCINERPAHDRIWSHAFASSQTWTTIGIMGSEDYSENLQQYQQLQQIMQEMEVQQEQQQTEVGPQGLVPPSADDEQEKEEDAEPLELIYSLHGYLFASGLDNICGSNVAKMGVMVHEYMHTLGLDDVYDYGTDSNGKGIGIWDILGYPYGPANDEDYPGHLSAYSKVSLGWLTPIEWTPANGTVDFTLSPAELSNHAIKIRLTNGTESSADQQQPQVIPGTGTAKMMPQYQQRNGDYEEYLLLEYRQALEYDRDLMDRTGLIIYHVDESVPRMNNRGYPGQDGWPENGKHYRVSVLAADSLYHLERGINRGDVGDTWKPGSILGPGTQEATRRQIRNQTGSPKRGFGTPDKTYPNTDTYQYGVVQETGIYVEPLSETIDSVIVRISWRDVLPEDDTEAERQSAKRTESNDCINLWSWVDLEVQDELGDHLLQSVHCDDVATDPESYCSLHDVACGKTVSEICRSECPGSDCYV